MSVCNYQSQTKGYTIVKQIGDTLQGFMHLGINDETQEKVAIKQYFKKCIKYGITKRGTRVPENFKKEMSNQLYLSQLPNSHHFPGFVRCRERLMDSECEYLILDLCDNELFEVIQEYHRLQIPHKKPKEYRQLVRNIFRELVNTVSYFHRNNICHLDLSLENIMTSNRNIKTHSNSNKSINLDFIQIKIIDFGTSQFFTNGTFAFKGMIGKNKYMAPEVYANRQFDARLADIWSLGIILFLMLIGGEPYSIQKKISETPALKLMLKGKLKELLIHFGVLQLIDSDSLDLMNKIFKLEKHGRINMKELRNHPFVNLGNEPKPEFLLTNIQKKETFVEEMEEVPTDENFAITVSES